MDKELSETWNAILNRYIVDNVDDKDIGKHIFHEKLKGTMSEHKEMRIKELYAKNP